MKGVLVDSSVILDLFTNDKNWADWSESVLVRYANEGGLYINPVIYSEISMGFNKIEEIEKAVTQCGFQLLQMPKEALFLAGKAFMAYRKRKGNKTSPLPDFYIGAHAAVAGIPLITRDTSRVKTYFPTVILISPD